MVHSYKLFELLYLPTTTKKDFIYFCFHSERPEEQLFCVQAATMLNKFTNAGEKINQ